MEFNIKARVIAAKRATESVIAYGFLIVLFIVLIIVYILLAAIGTVILTLTDLRGLSKSDISLDDLETVLLTTESRRAKEGFVSADFVPDILDSGISVMTRKGPPRTLSSICNPAALIAGDSGENPIREVAPEERIYIGWHTLPGVARVRSLIIPGDVPRELGGESFLLIHGMNSTSISAWIMILAELKTRANAIYAIDLPGFGISQWCADYSGLAADDPSEKYVRVIGDYCGAVIKENIKSDEDPRLVLVGHSLGAYLAAKTALDVRYSARFSRLVLASVVGVLPSLGRLGAFFGMMFKVNVPALCYKMPFRRAIKKMYWKSVKNRRLCAYLMYEAEFIAAMPARSPLYDFIVCSPLGMYWAAPILVELSRLAIPFSTISGAGDLIAPVHTGESIRVVYGAAHHVVEDAGHSVMYEKPREFVGALFAPHYRRVLEQSTGAEIALETPREPLSEAAIKKLESLLAEMMKRATNMSILYDFKITAADWKSNISSLEL